MIIISYFNLCIQNADGKTEITRENIYKSENNYSQGRYQACQDEWEENFGDITILCNFLKLSNEIFMLTEIKEDDFLDFLVCEDKRKLSEYTNIIRTEYFTDQNFDILAKNFSMDPSRKNGGKVGFLTLPQIRSSLGQEAADEVARLKPNQVGKMIYTPFGLTVLKVGQVKSAYKDLKPLAEGLLAESKRTDLTFRLFQKAKVVSPFMDSAPDSLPNPDEPGIKPGREASGSLTLPKPDGSDSVNELPPVENATPVAPVKLPEVIDEHPGGPAELPKPEQ